MEKLRDQFARKTDPAKQKVIAEAVQIQATEMVTHIPLGQWYQRSLIGRDAPTSGARFLGIWNCNKRAIVDGLSRHRLFGPVIAEQSCRVGHRLQYQ
jgi:hypothetical protein